MLLSIKCDNILGQCVRNNHVFCNAIKQVIQFLALLKKCLLKVLKRNH